jgi:hypothetical protein
MSYTEAGVWDLECSTRMKRAGNEYYEMHDRLNSALPSIFFDGILPKISGTLRGRINDNFQIINRASSS